MATTWTPIASVVQTTIPNDITGNSVSVAPVSGDATAVGIKLGNGTSTLFSVDATGKLIAASSSIQGNEQVLGNLAVGGTLTANGLTNTGSGTAAGLYSSIAGSATTPSIGYSNQTDTGVYLATQSTSAAILALAVNGVQALALNKSGATVPGTFTVSGASTFAGVATGALTASSISDTGALNVSGATTLAALTASAISAASLTLSGNLNVSGNETIVGTSTITGLLTANGNIATPIVKTTAAPAVTQVNSANYTVSNVSLPGTFGDGNNYPPSGISSDTLGNLSLNYQGSPAIRMANTGYSSQAGNSPLSSFPTTFLSGSYNFQAAGNTQLGISSTAVKFGFTANTVPVTMQAFSGNILQLQNGGSSPSFTTTTVGTVDTSGNATFAGVLKGTSVTFGDGSSQTTAYTSTSANNQSKWVATSNGTTALPAFTYTANTDTGEYLKTSSTTAAVLGLSVNATDAMTLTKTGVTVPGTLAVTGATSLTGALTAAAISSTSLTASGAVKGTALTITASGGALTFGDGTTQTTAAAAATAGQAAIFAATSNGSNTAPVFSSKQYTNSGIYFNPNNTTSTNVDFAVDGTQICDWSSSVASFKIGLSGTTGTFTGTLSAQNIVTSSSTATTTIGGPLSANGILSVAGKSTFNAQMAAPQGSAATPGIVFGTDTATGFSQTLNPSTINVNVAGATVASIVAAGINVTGSVSGTRLFSSTAGSAASVNYANTAGNSGLYVTQSGAATPTVGFALTGASVLSSTATLLTLPLAATCAGTFTSTTAAGTASFVSSQGFKQRVDLGHLYVTSSTTTAAQTYRSIATSGGSSVFTALASEAQAFAGSVVSIQCTVTGNTGATTTASTVQLYKNGAAVSGATLSLTATQTSNTVTFAKGTYTFAANDTLQAFVTYGTAGANIANQVSLEVEQGA